MATNFDYESWRSALLKRLQLCEWAFEKPQDLKDIEHDDDSLKRARFVLALDQISGIINSLRALPGFNCALPLKPANELMGQLSDFAKGKRADLLDLPITMPRADPMAMAPTKGFASFAVNVLLQSNRTQNDANTEVAQIMGDAGFTNRTGAALTKETVRRWCEAAISDDNVKTFERRLWSKFVESYGDDWISVVVPDDVLDWLGKVAKICLEHSSDG